MVLTAFGLVTVDSIANFAPFNASSPNTEPPSQNQKRKSFRCTVLYYYSNGIPLSLQAKALRHWVSLMINVTLRIQHGYNVCAGIATTQVDC